MACQLKEAAELLLSKPVTKKEFKAALAKTSTSKTPLINMANATWETELRDVLNTLSESRKGTLIQLADKTDKKNSSKKGTGFQGYVGGFNSKGKGTSAGDGKDKAMRKVADGFIGEIGSSKGSRSSSATSLRHWFTTLSGTELDKEISRGVNSWTSINRDMVPMKDSSVIMLARNSEFKGKPISKSTKDNILTEYRAGSTFVVGDMPGVDSQFIDYLEEIGASYKIYHNGDTPRINYTESRKGTSKPQTASEGKSTRGSGKSAPEAAKAQKTIIDSNQKELGATTVEFDKKLNTRLKGILKKLYPEIKLEYTEQEILHGEGVMNQEVVSNTVKFSLKVVEALNEWAAIKPSKHGGTSQPILKTIRTKQEAGVRKKLAGKGVSKEQIDFVFEYMKQNDINEIDTAQLADRVLLGLATSVDINTRTTGTKQTGKKDLTDAEIDWIEENIAEMEEDLEDASTEEERTRIQISIDEERAKISSIDLPERIVNTDYYASLTVPGGTNYQEKEIATPSIIAPKKGHADFATDKGIGWYRVDDSTKQEGTLRVLEMQSDMFQKMKDEDLSKESRKTNNVVSISSALGERQELYYKMSKIDQEKVDRLIETVLNDKSSDEDYKSAKKKILAIESPYLKLYSSINLEKAFLQLLNTDNKWAKFFIQSIVQDATKKGYKKIKFPSGETAAQIEGHDSIAARIRAIDKKINSLNSNKDEYLAELATEETEHLNEIINIHRNPVRVKGAKIQLERLNDDPGLYFEKELKTYSNRGNEIDLLKSKKAELKTEGLEKLAPIEGFYQVRVYNTLVKTYGKENVKTVTDEHGNGWFELTLDATRDGSTIMLQRDGTDHVTLVGSKLKSSTLDITNTAGDVVGTMRVNYNSSLSKELGRSDLGYVRSKFGSAELKSTIIMLDDLYIEEEFRSRSYGINAVDQLIAESQGKKDILLDSYPTDGTIDQNNLNKFYESLGFEVIPEAAKEGVYLMKLNKEKFNNAKQRNSGGKIKGQADLEAKTVLINSLLQSQDTLPHEYAHHYISWFRDTKIVQDGIEKWGSEEALVQAIGEQVVAQKGEALDWWKKFTAWVQEKFDSYYKGLDKVDKEQLQKLLTDAFLTRKDLKSMEDDYSGVSALNSKDNTTAITEYESDLSSLKKTKPERGLGASEEVSGLNEVIISDEEYQVIKESNQYYKDKHPKMFSFGDEYRFHDDTNTITLLDPTLDNDVDEQMHEVYTAHEIAHALTWEYLNDPANKDTVTYLKNALKVAKRDFEPGRSLEEHLLADRLTYASTNGYSDIHKVAELVAILSSEPNIRKSFIEAFPQTTRSKLEKILDVIKAFIAKNIGMEDTGDVIATVDAIMKAGKINPIHKTNSTSRGIGAIEALGSANKEADDMYMEMYQPTTVSVNNTRTEEVVDTTPKQKVQMYFNGSKSGEAREVKKVSVKDNMLTLELVKGGTYQFDLDGRVTNGLHTGITPKGSAKVKSIQANLRAILQSIEVPAIMPTQISKEAMLEAKAIIAEANKKCEG